MLHLGDHDPSGMDMTRDNRDRLDILKAVVEVKRLALNMDQVEEYGPPPNPAKVTDSRFAAYVTEYGDESWELDALEPRVISELIEEHVKMYRDDYKYQARLEEQEATRETFSELSDRWDEVKEFLDG